MNRENIKTGSAGDGIADCLRRAKPHQRLSAGYPPMTDDEYLGEPFAAGEAKAMAQMQPGSVNPVAKVVRQPLLFAKRKTKSTVKPHPIPAGAVAEYRFHPTRRWRIDFAYPAPELKIAVEIEGGAFTRGRHTRGAGFVADMAKYNELSLTGWILIRVTPQQFKNGTAAELVKRAFEFRKSGGQ